MMAKKMTFVDATGAKTEVKHKGKPRKSLVRRLKAWWYGKPSKGVS